MRVHAMLVGCSLLAGCLGTIDAGPDEPAIAEEGGPPAGSDFDRAMLEIALSYESSSQINSRPYRSSLGGFQINLYVVGDDDEYREIHPETVEASDELAVGTVIVREVLDAQGEIAKLTLMAKGPKGYDPAIGDWWFGEATPKGVPLVAGDAVRLGRLTDCHGCHLPRAAEDFLFGVPAAEQDD
jgi:hypothetical protein